MSHASERASLNQSGISMADRLLARQSSLLDYLSSPTTLFGDHADIPADPALAGIDPGVLCLLARFACNKRLERISAVFPLTFKILAPDQEGVLRQFVAISRPTQKGTLANAREFHEFLSSYWHDEPPIPAYVPDVAACELAIAEARNIMDEPERPAVGDSAKRVIRRRRGVIPLRCAHDVRLLFRAEPALPPERDTSLVFTLPAGHGDVTIFEVAPEIVDALTVLDDWADPTTLDAFGARVVDRLRAYDFVELRSDKTYSAC